MKNLKEFLQSQDLCVVACIESFSTRKGEEYLDVWLRMEKWFSSAKIPVVLLSRDNMGVCSRMEMIYSIEYLFRHDENDTFFISQNVLKTKLVFGKETTIVYPYIFLFKDGEVIKVCKRMSEKTIGQVYLSALDFRYKTFLRNFKNMFDIT